MSMDMLKGESGVKDYGLERLIMLSDGVFAIAITLLAIELHLPEHWDRTAVGLINGMWREFFAYVISFLVIAVYWASHRRTFSRFRRSDAGLTAINFVILGLITLLPFGSKMIAEGGPTGEPYLLYLGLISAIGFANALLWGYAAFFADILKDRLPLGLRLIILLILLIVPTAMGGAGMMMHDPKNWWMMLGAAAFSAVIIFIRRRLGKMAGE
jgi:uncharacterized membrane protein